MNSHSELLCQHEDLLRRIKIHHMAMLASTDKYVLFQLLFVLLNCIHWGYFHFFHLRLILWKFPLMQAQVSYLSPYILSLKIYPTNLC